jgi:hypothetical protein
VSSRLLHRGPRVAKAAPRGKPITVRAQPRPIASAPLDPLPLIRSPAPGFLERAPRGATGKRCGSRKSSAERAAGRQQQHPAPACPMASHRNTLPNQQPTSEQIPVRHCRFPSNPLKHETATAKAKNSLPLSSGNFSRRQSLPFLTGDAQTKQRQSLSVATFQDLRFAFRFHFSLANERTERPHEQMNLTRTTQDAASSQRSIKNPSRGARHECLSPSPPRRRQMLDSRAARHSQRPTVG